MTKRLILAFLLSCSPLWATTYYVDNCVTVGSDRNNGTSASTPWLTVAKVNASTFSAGSSVLFQKTCTWREQLVPPSSGSSGNPITFGAYGTGAAPILNGTSLVTSWTLSSGNIYYASVTYLPNTVFQNGLPLTLEASTGAMIAGSYFYNSGTSTLYVWMTDGSNPAANTVEAGHYPIVSSLGNSGANAGLIDIASKSYITINGLDVRESNYFGVRLSAGNYVTVQNSSFEYGYHNGITGDETRAVANSSNISVLNNTFSYTGIVRHRGCCEGVGVNVMGFQTATVSGNNIANGWGEGIQVDGGANNITITTNEINSPIKTGIYICDGWGLGGNTTNVAVTYNYVNDVLGIPYAFELENTYDLIGIQVYGNIGICGTTPSDGILFGYNSPGGYLQNFTIVNNTIYNCEYGIGAFGPTIDASNVFENNILYAQYPWRLYDSNQANYSPNYDVLYSTSGTDVIWEGTFYSLSAFVSATGKMTHSVAGNPQFVNASAGQFWLTSGSPAIDAGLNLGSPYNIGLMPGSTWPNSVVTGDQNAYGSGWEIGAFIYVPALAPPSNLQAFAH